MGAFQERVTSAIASQERRGGSVVRRLQDQPAAVYVALWRVGSLEASIFSIYRASNLLLVSTFR